MLVPVAHHHPDHDVPQLQPTRKWRRMTPEPDDRQTTTVNHGIPDGLARVRKGVNERMRAYLRSLGDLPSGPSAGSSTPTASSQETTVPSTTRTDGYQIVIAGAGDVTLSLAKDSAQEALAYLTAARTTIAADPNDAVPVWMGSVIYQLEQGT